MSAQFSKEYLFNVQEICWKNRLACLQIVDTGGAFLPLQSDIFLRGGRGFANQALMSSQGIQQVEFIIQRIQQVGFIIQVIQQVGFIIQVIQQVGFIIQGIQQVGFIIQGIHQVGFKI